MIHSVLIFDLIQASKKKLMIKDGILGKFGKPTEQTPKNWRDMLYDVSAVPPVPKVN